MVKQLRREKDIDTSLHEKMAEEAVKEIEKVGSYEYLLSDDIEFMNPPEEPLPWDKVA